MSGRANNNRKGNKAELEVKRLLEAQGYYVHRTVRTNHHGFVNAPNDIFGCDIIAKKEGERTRWIQVTCDGHIGRKKAELALVPWDSQHDSVEVWRRVGIKRKHKVTGETPDSMYYVVYHRDDMFDLKLAKKVHL